MSHFSVAVFTDENTTVEDLLEPYWENLIVDKYVCMTKEELIDSGRSHIRQYMRVFKEYMKDKKAFRRKYKNDLKHLRFVKKIPLMKKWDKERIYKFMISDCSKEDISEDGGLYSDFNPKARWDWFSIGGRWADMLILKTDNPSKIVRADSGLVKEIDWDRMKRIKWLKMESYEEFFKNIFWDKEFYKKLYPNEEAYINGETSFSTYSVVTPDGEWHDSGKMGWWGVSEATDEERVEFENNYEEKFLRNLNPEWRLTIVDCHI